jgi:hypothetical protein
MSGDDGEKKFTQADVDRIVQDRVNREKVKYDEVVAENTALKEKVAEHEKTSLDSLKTKIATDLKLPPALASRLAGTTEAELKADGEKLLKEIGPKEPVGGGGNPAGEVKKPLTREAVKAMKPDEIIANMDQIKSQMKEGSLR